MTESISVRVYSRPGARYYPPWIYYSSMWVDGGMGWHVECQVCGRYTGRRRNRDRLAALLRQHKRCGLIDTNE